MPPVAPAPTLISLIQAWLPVLTQGGFAVVAIVLGLVCRAMWNRHLLDVKEKENLYKDFILDARKESAQFQDLLREVVEEQTKSRRVVERLDRKLGKDGSP